MRFKVNAAKKDMIIKINKAKKLSFKLDISAKKPNNTGPTKKPKKPTPEMKEILMDASIWGVLPPNLKSSGIITERPSPTNPKPNTAMSG